MQYNVYVYSGFYKECLKPCNQYALNKQAEKEERRRKPRLVVVNSRLSAHTVVSNGHMKHNYISLIAECILL